MAIDPELLRRDRIGVACGQRVLDTRVEVDGEIYYVLPRFWEFEMTLEANVGRSLLDDVFSAVSIGLARVLAHVLRRGPRIFVYRLRPRGILRWRMPRVHCEVLPLRADPAPRVLELIAEIESGRFRPTT